MTCNLDSGLPVPDVDINQICFIDVDGSIERFIVDSGKKKNSCYLIVLTCFSFFYSDGTKKGRAWNIKKLVKLTSLLL